MQDEANFLHESMEEFLVAMPPDDVVERSREAVRNYLDAGRGHFESIRWVEFSAQGTAVRSGISSTQAMSTQLLSNWDEDELVQEIVEYSRLNGVRVGEFHRSDDGENHLWSVPYTHSTPALKPENRIRVIQINEGLLGGILDLFNQDAHLTAAEKRVLFQVLAGSNTSQAAREDGLSTETKRSQLKIASAKLNCHGQTELVRLMVSQMIHLLFICEAETSEVRLTEEFTSTCFGDIARLSVQRLSNGNLIRYWEFGPRNGRPVLAMHGYLFPLLVLNSTAQFEKHDIRLILPLRAGFLDSQSASGVLKVETLAEENLDNLALFAKTLSDDPVPLLGHIMGATYAMILAKQHADLFSNVICASTFVMREEEEENSVPARFINGMRKLAKSSGIYEIAVRQFQKAVLMNEEVTKITLRRLFRHSPHDLATVNGSNGAKPVFDWFRMVALNSVLGISSDLTVMTRDISSLVADIEIPLHFIHADDDPYQPPSVIKELAAANPEATVRVLSEGGHYVSASKPAEFWDEVAEQLG